MLEDVGEGVVEMHFFLAGLDAQQVNSEVGGF
jgi:hypothetical protein